jgi:hypothetical protein
MKAREKQIAIVAAVGAAAAAAFAWMFGRSPSEPAAESAPAPAPGATPPAGPTGKRELLDVKGLRELIAREPGFPKAYFAMTDAMGWGPEQVEYLTASIGGIESGFDPAATNAVSGATGLIQFMPKTASTLGTTTDALRAMSATDQLEYVRKYFKDRKLAPRDVYPAIFYPIAIGKSDDKVLGTKTLDMAVAQGFSTTISEGAKISPADFAVKVYNQNRGLDVNGDGLLVAGDIRRKADNVVATARNKPRIVAELA